VPIHDGSHRVVGALALLNTTGQCRPFTMQTVSLAAYLIEARLLQQQFTFFSHKPHIILPPFNLIGLNHCCKKYLNHPSYRPKFTGENASHQYYETTSASLLLP
jgi:hypothetical protein